MDTYTSWSGIGGGGDGNPIPTSYPGAQSASQNIANAATAATTALSSIDGGFSNLQILNNSTLVTSALSTIGDAQFFEESISPSTVRTQLSVTGDPSNASTTLNLLKGMKWLLANMSKGRDVSDFFPHVVKLVGAPNLEVRKMVYIYLARYSDHDAQCREMALLSINAFQRGLADREPLLRSLALRVLTCMDVPDVLQLQILGVRTCCKDSSPYVRKCAANALAKLHPRCLRMGDETQAENLVEIATTLLQEDASTMVLTSAMIAFGEICPHRLDLLHGCYRKVCHLLTDMDEWGQVIVMDLLARYCRTFFKQPRGQTMGAAERIDKERRVTRSTRKMGVEDVAAEEDKVDEEPNEGIDSLLSFTATTTANTATAANGSSSPANALPPYPKTKTKRRVVRKAFYSDEEDESSEEEVDPYYPVTGGNVAGTLREPTLLGGSGKFGFRDDVNASDGGDGSTFGKSGPSSALGGMATVDVDDDEESDLDEDHKLLLHSSLPLLKSRNSAVVLAVCSLHYYCGVASIKTRSALGKALVRIHRDRREIQYVVLVSIRTLVQECPSAFSPFLNDFFVKGLDPSFTRMIKLDILVSLCIDPAAIDAVLTELRAYVRHNDKAFACASVRAVGKVVELARVVYDRRARTAGLDFAKARTDANVIALNCLSGLVTLSECSRNEMVLGECAETMQRVLSQLWSEDGVLGKVANGEIDLPVVSDHARIQERALKRLLLILVSSLTLDEESGEKEEEGNRLEFIAIRVPDSAVASILWVIGEWFTTSDETLSAWNIDETKKSKIRSEILRLAAKSFLNFDRQIKLHAVHLASKVLLMLKSNQASTIGKIDGDCALCELILAMGRLDVSQDVRDRSRYESNVLHISVGLSSDVSALQALPVSGASIDTKRAKSMLLHRKPNASSLPLDGKEFGSAKNETDLFRFGTLSSVVCNRTGGSNAPLPDWAHVNSSSTLRDPALNKPEEKPGDEWTTSNEANEVSGLYSSSSEDDSSSSSSSNDESSSSSNDDSSDDSSDDSDYDSESSGGSGDNDQVGTNNGFDVKSAMLLPTQEPESLIPSLVIDDVNESTSSDDSSDDDSSSEEALNANVPLKPTVGTILDIEGATNQTQMPLQYAKQTSDNSSSVAAGLEGLVMTPLVVDRNDISQPSNIETESGLWKEFVRPELGGGLFVKMRYLHGQVKTREAQLMGIDPKNPCTVCLQAHIENRRTDAGTLRHIRIVHRGWTSNGIVAPSKVATPPEIPALKKAKASTVFLGITFASATDRDGSAVAKFDIKSDRGTTPIEIRPTLGEFLIIPKAISQSDFDKAFSELQGIHQRISSTFSLSPVTNESVKNLPNTIMKHMNLKQIGKYSAKACFVGTLPESKQNVYIEIKCDPATGYGDIIVCSNNALSSNSIMNILKQALAND